MMKLIALSTLMLTSVAQADCSIELGVADNMNFVPTTLLVSKSSCPTVTLNLTHTGQLPANVMGHNFVLSSTADAQALAQAGWGAGLDNQYLPPNDPRTIANTKIIGGGQTASPLIHQY